MKINVLVTKESRKSLDKKFQFIVINVDSYYLLNI